MTPNQKKLLLIGSIIAVITGSFGIFYWVKVLHLNTTVTFTSQTQSNSQLISENSGSVQVETTGEIGFISEIIGEASYIVDSKRNTLKPEMKILAGTSIITEEGSSLTIILTDNSLIRLNEKTTISFSNTEKVVLESGDVWARIIKPLTDDSFFTIETSDSSAGIRGTAVLVQKTINKTKTTVIDSSLPKDPISISYTVNGILETEKMNTEEIVEISKQGKKKQSITVENILDIHEFVPEFIKKDILYLANLEQGLASQTGSEILEKIQKEIQESLPKENEIGNFFVSESTRDAMKLLQKGKLGGSGSGEIRLLTSNEQKKILLDIILGDLEITKNKGDLQRLRDNSNATTPGDERKNQIHEMEQKIREKEILWGNAFKESFESNYKIGWTSETMSGTGILNNSGSFIATGSLIENNIIDSTETTNKIKPFSNTGSNDSSKNGSIGSGKIFQNSNQDINSNTNKFNTQSKIHQDNNTQKITSGSAKPVNTIKQPVTPIIKKTVSGSAGVQK